MFSTLKSEIQHTGRMGFLNSFSNAFNKKVEKSKKYLSKVTTIDAIRHGTHVPIGSSLIISLLFFYEN